MMKQEKEEEPHISSSSSASAHERDQVSLSRLRKYYTKKVDGKSMVHKAVNGVSIGVRRREVLGLLGPNGAGKSTCVSIVVGEIPPTDGSVDVLGNKISRYQRPHGVPIGYCPQGNGLWDELTPTEHLRLFARISGMGSHRANRLISELAIEEHAHKRVNQLSGGTKRKVCAAIAICSRPSILIYDEVSSGIDIATRRHLWALMKEHQRDSCIILTTHMMDEADHLSTRIAIIVEGKLQCIGTPQHLKSKFGHGYLLQLMLEDSSSDMVERVKESVQQEFPMAKVVEENFGRLTFQINTEELRGGVRVQISAWELFRSAEKIASNSELGIREHSLSQSTLEHVFLSFARQQRRSND